MNRRAKGSRNERRSRAILEASGYNVTRATGSMGAWDLIGIGSQDIIMLQVKTRDWPSGVEMESLRLFVCPSNCRRLVHRWRDRVSLPDVREL